MGLAKFQQAMQVCIGQRSSCEFTRFNKRTAASLNTYKEEKMSMSKKKDIEDLFKLFDKDKDGLISKDDLKLVLRKVDNPSDAEIQTICEQMGVKKDGKQQINFEMFSKCIETLYYKTDKGSEEKELKRSFELFDKNNDGTIDVKELKKVLTSIGEKLTDKEVDAMFKGADMNKDGKIQYNEFVKLFTKDLK